MQPGAFPSILAVGDSWFWYPLPTGYNLLQTLADRVLKPVYTNILSLGYIGAKLEQYTDRNDPVYRQAIVTRLIDKVHDTFALHDDGWNVHLVDSRGCLDPAQDWDNELHPNTQGFRKLAEGPWRKTLQDFGFA